MLLIYTAKKSTITRKNDGLHWTRYGSMQASKSKGLNGFKTTDCLLEIIHNSVLDSLLFLLHFWPKYNFYKAIHKVIYLQGVNEFLINF